MLEGLLAYEALRGPSSAVTRARLRGQEYLLERGLYRRKSTGEVIDPAWAQFTFPTRWQYDVLRGLDYLRTAGVRDARLAEAIALVEAKRDAGGRWPLEAPHPGDVHFELEGAPGEPSRWLTLRALRVLGWFRS